MNRRELLKTSASLLAGAAVCQAGMAQNGATGGTLSDRALGDPVLGEHALGDAALNDHANIPRTNWSKNFHYSTDRVYAPSSLAEVQAIVRQSERLKPLGSRHCFNNIADSRYAQISMLGLDSIAIDAANRTVTVGAGVRYGTLAPVIDAQGFALANLASLPHITVGGSIATATHGSGEGNGNLATQVSGLEMVLADGEVLHLDRARDGQRFLDAVVHLGALGVVTAVTLDLLPSFTMTQTVYEDLSFDRLEHDFDAIMGSAYSVSLFTNWQGHRATEVWMKSKLPPGAKAPEYASLPKTFHGATLQRAKLHPVRGQDPEKTTDQMGSVGKWYERLPHFKMGFTPSTGDEIQTEYFVARKDAYRAILAVETLRDEITPHLFVTEIRTIAQDKLAMSMAYERDSVAIHFTWKPEREAVRQLTPKIEAALEPFGVRPHWGKANTVSPRIIQGEYARLAAFKTLAARLDAQGKFRNEYLENTLYTTTALAGDTF